ncbi:MAG: hypothetical protein KDA89_08150, partial [Planctomycetaceae bacterium]|nr:hypothetical protein [Planctomycetaceae bacterium]
MMRFVVLLALWFSVPVMVQAQGLRVSTIVYDAGRLDSSGQEPILSTGFSLFHNGRVYDYVEAVGEVVIFEPSDKRFTILNPAGKVRTTVAFGEVQHLLESREPRTQEYIRELSAADSPEAERASRVLEFQMNPKFETVYDRRTGLLKLSAPSWKYSVSTREWQNPDQIKHYLAYADWTARLNYVLHPSSMFPEPRLVLNEELRKLENRIPVVVQLDLRPDERRVLRAEHQFVKSLTDQDHSLISSW